MPAEARPDGAPEASPPLGNSPEDQRPRHARLPVEVGDVQVAIGQENNARHEAPVGTPFLNDGAVSGSQLEGVPGSCHLQSKVVSWSQRPGESSPQTEDNNREEPGMSCRGTECGPHLISCF